MELRMLASGKHCVLPGIHRIEHEEIEGALHVRHQDRLAHTTPQISEYNCSRKKDWSRSVTLPRDYMFCLYDHCMERYLGEREHLSHFDRHTRTLHDLLYLLRAR